MCRPSSAGSAAACSAGCWARMRRAAFRWCAAGGARRESFVDSSGAATEGDGVAVAHRAWLTLRKRPLLVGLLEDRRLIDVAQQLAGRLRVHKLVLVAARGRHRARRRARRCRSWTTAMLTAVLQPGQAEWAGLAARRDTLDAVRAALRAGVRVGEPLLARWPGARALHLRGLRHALHARGLLPHRAARHRRLRGGRAAHRARPARGVPEAALADGGGAHPAQRLRCGDRLAPLRRRLRARDRRIRAEQRRRDRRPVHDHAIQGRGRRRPPAGAGARGGARRRPALRIRLHDRRARARHSSTARDSGASRPTRCRRPSGSATNANAARACACCATTHRDLAIERRRRRAPH